MVLNSPRGTADIYGPDLEYRNYIISKSKELFARFNYSQIVTPTFEHTEVFSRSIGEATDIVQKEMYTFKDKKGRSLTLRPEGTASIVRSVVENKLYSGNLPLKLFYSGNMFRYERPQKGRMREFFQLGAEAVGSDNPLIDAEMIWLINDLFKAIGFRDLVLLVNSMGCEVCRKGYIKEFKSFLARRKEKLCGECRQRYEQNPLRIFDCKNKSCKKELEGSPRISDYLCRNCAGHFDKLAGYLKLLGINFEVSHELVRGFDYYTRTVFEVISKQIKSAQNALGGGGRYDKLIKQFGGPDLPAIGFAIGVERTSMLMQQLGIEPGKQKDRKRIYMVSMEQKFSSFLIKMLKFFRNDFICDTNFNIRSISKELKWAEKNGYDFAFIIGEEEFRNSMVSIKDIKEFKQHTFKWEKEKDKILDLLRGN
ncbi:MAG: histidine--tRNA ligase [Actinomycetota bacterium]